MMKVIMAAGKGKMKMEKCELEMAQVYPNTLILTIYHLIPSLLINKYGVKKYKESLIP